MLTNERPTIRIVCCAANAAKHCKYATHQAYYNYPEECLISISGAWETIVNSVSKVGHIMPIPFASFTLFNRTRSTPTIVTVMHYDIVVEILLQCYVTFLLIRCVHLRVTSRIVALLMNGSHKWKSFSHLFIRWHQKRCELVLMQLFRSYYTIPRRNPKRPNFIPMTNRTQRERHMQGGVKQF